MNIRLGTENPPPVLGEVPAKPAEGGGPRAETQAEIHESLSLPTWKPLNDHVNLTNSRETR